MPNFVDNNILDAQASNFYMLATFLPWIWHRFQVYVHNERLNCIRHRKRLKKNHFSRRYWL